MKKLLTILLVFLSLISFGQMRNDLSAGKKNDLIHFNSAQDSVVYICVGDVFPNDSPPRFYIYAAISTVTADGENVLYATGMGGTGRYIKCQTGSYSAGSGISIAGTSISNTSPDQIVSLIAGNLITITGSYPNFTIAKTKRQETYTGSTNASGLYTIIYSTAYTVTPNIQYNLGVGATNKETIIPQSSTATGFSYLVQSRSDVLGLLPSYAVVSGREVNIIVTEK